MRIKGAKGLTDLPSECHRCCFNGRGDPVCVECVRVQGRRFGQPSKRGHTLVSLEALTEQGGTIYRDTLLAPHASTEYSPRLSHERLWRIVAEEAGVDPDTLLRAVGCAVSRRTREGLGCIAASVGVPLAALLRACERARARMGEAEVRY